MSKTGAVIFFIVVFVLYILALVIVPIIAGTTSNVLAQDLVAILYGIPLALLNKGLRSAIDTLFKLKFFLLGLCIISSVFIYRPFCRYICPLGAFYALFQKVSFIRMRFDGDKCIHCGACAKVCQMKVDPVKTPNSCECIRCGECVSACPKSALELGVCKGEGKIIAEQE